MADFRSDKMPSSEGRGIARRAWDAYSNATSRYLVQPVFGSAIASFSASAVADLVGFWVLWHLHGGFEGLRNLGMSRSAIFRKTAMFRRVFGKHPDEMEFPGIALDVERYLASGRSGAVTDLESKDS